LIKSFDVTRSLSASVCATSYNVSLVTILRLNVGCEMFSPAVLEHFLNPRNRGPLKEATCTGMAGVFGQGPYMQLWIRSEADQILDASFDTYGCPAAIACGSFISEWIKGRSTEQVGNITARDLDRILGGLPAGKEHCPELAVTALHSALIHLGRAQEQE